MSTPSRLPMLALTFALFLAAPWAVAQTPPTPCTVDDDAPAETVAGAVVDGSGVGVAGARVVFRCGDFQQTVDSASDGSFSLAVPPGRFEVVVTKTGVGTVDRVVPVEAGGRSDLEIRLALQTVFETVRVVGTRVRETVAETSTSVRVFTARDLETRPGTREVRDLFGKTPNVVDFGEGTFAPAIRGVDATGAASGGLGFIAGTRPRATLTVDGRPLTTFGFIGGPTGLWDVQQVEVYRGPQTTLQGRNSIAGAIVVETKDPTFSWEGGLRLAAGTEDRQRLSAVVSGPLVADSLAFRVAVDRFAGESFVDFLGPQGVEDVEDDESLAVRGKLLWAPQAAPAFTAQLTLAHKDTRRPQSQLADPPFGERRRTTSQTVFEIRSDDLVLDLEYAFGPRWFLSNSTSYSDVRFDRRDAPARGQFVLEGPLVTNETLLNLDDPENGLRGVFGTYLFHENRDDAGFLGTPLAFTFDDETRTAAVFGELEWSFVEDVRATAGLRYERETRERQGSAFGIVTDLDETFDAVLPRLGLAFDPTERTTVGLMVSRGFNAGGGSVSFGASDPAGNPSPDPALGPRSFVFDSEFVWNYEVYTRATLLGGSVFLTGNLFYGDYEDQQRVEQLDFPGGFTDSIIVNTPESHSYGVEVGVVYAPDARLELYADIGLLRTGIDESNEPALEGNELARSPSVSSSFGVNLRPWDGWHFGLDASYVDDYFSTDVNSPLSEVGGHFLANARAAWQALPYLEVSATVTNLFDSDAEQRLFAFPAGAPPSLANVVEPRVVWLEAKLDF